MPDPDATAEITVDAPPETVYALVSDLPRLSAVAAEFQRGTWLDGATAAAVGARFRGHNRNSWRRWWTVATVTAAEPGRRFAFDVVSMGFVPISRWQYDIEPTGTGCLVRESTWSRVPRWFLPIGAVTTGTFDRAGSNQRNIERTLRQLKTVCEGPRDQGQ
jgi:polyketide cyclase/dehydrase/lipid transport protein